MDKSLFTHFANPGILAKWWAKVLLLMPSLFPILAFWVNSMILSVWGSIRVFFVLDKFFGLSSPVG